MNIEQEGEIVFLSEPIEEPLMVFLGEGSGEELKVGNEEKKKIFFFGQPGCLKHSPIRTNTPENHNNHNKPPDGASITNVATKLFPESENMKTPEKDASDQASDDDENDDLLQKITEALKDKKALPGAEKQETSLTNDTKSSTETPTEMSLEQKNEINDSSLVEDINKSCTISESEDKKSSTIVKENVENSKEINVSSEESDLKVSKKVPTVDGSESAELSEKSSKDVKAPAEIRISEYKSKSVQIIMKSIVPYDDDSMSSSSQPETEKGKEITEVNDSVLEANQLDISASKSSEIDEKLDNKPVDEPEEEKEVIRENTVEMTKEMTDESFVEKLDDKPTAELEEGKEIVKEYKLSVSDKSEEKLVKPTVEEEKVNVEESTLNVPEKSPELNLGVGKSSEEDDKILEVEETLMTKEDKEVSEEVIKVVENQKPKSRSPSPAVHCENIKVKEIVQPESSLEISISNDDLNCEERNVEENLIAANETLNVEQEKTEVSHWMPESAAESEEAELQSEKDLRQKSPAVVDEAQDNTTYDDSVPEASEGETDEKEVKERAILEEKSSVKEIPETREEVQALNVEIGDECEMKLPEITNVEQLRTSDEQLKLDEKITKAAVADDEKSSTDPESHSFAVLSDEVANTDEKANQNLEDDAEEKSLLNDVSSKLDVDEGLHQNQIVEELKEPSEVLPEQITTKADDENQDENNIDEKNTFAQSSSETLNKPIESVKETIEESYASELDNHKDFHEQEERLESSSIPAEISQELGSKDLSKKPHDDETTADNFTPTLVPKIEEAQIYQEPEEHKETDDLILEKEKADDESLNEDECEDEISGKSLNDIPLEHSAEELPDFSEGSKIVEEPTETLDKNEDVSDLSLQTKYAVVEHLQAEKEADDSSKRPLDETADLPLQVKQANEEPAFIEEEEKLTPEPRPEQSFNVEENIDSPDDFNDYQDGVASDNDSLHSDKEDDDEEAVKADFLEKPVDEKQSENAISYNNELKEMSEVSAKSLPVKLEENVKLPDAQSVDKDSPVNSIKSIETLVEKPKVKTEIAAVTIEEGSSKDQLVTIVKDAETRPEKPVEADKAATRKRKISERKSISESDSEGNIVADSVSKDNSTDDDDVVMKKKPRMRGKTTISRKSLPARKSARNADDVKKPELEAKAAVPPVELKEEKKEDTEQTLQNFKFDYDESEDIVAKVAAIRTMISKEPLKETASDKSEDEDSERKASSKRTVRTKRGRSGKKNDVESSSDEDSAKQSKETNSKRSKTANESKDQQSSPGKKKRETGPKGLLKYIDTSLVIETTENEAPVRMSRRIAQQKIREETERRQMEEKMLKQMKAEAEKKKKGGSDDDADPDAEVEEEDQKESSEECDESFKGLPRKKKSKILASDKQWQTSSSHSEHSESEDYLEHVPSDPGSPLFRSDHEFSPESDDDDATQVQPLKRARTAKKLEAVASSEEEDINPNHACQVCHKTDSPEWILLCDECDCGYHCSCLKPIIFLIPSGNWFCPLCCQKKLVTSLEDQLTQLDTMIHNIETAELRRQRQQLAEITEQNIIQERRKNKRQNESREKSVESKKSSSSGSDDSSEDAPLKDYFYKLRKRNEKAAPSYRFNEYDDLINHAISRGMDDSKVAGNLGRGKDISTIIEAEDGNEQEKQNASDTEKPPSVKEDGGESSGSDVIRPKKISKGKKKSRKLNQLDVSSEDERVSDVDFKGTSSSDSEVDEEDLSMSSVSESSLDLPSKKGKGRNIRKSTRNREKRVDRRFINDNDSDSDDEPLVKVKRTRKKNDSDEEDFDINDDEDDEGSLAEEIDSEDLCDDTDTDDSSEGNWPRKKKKRNASYDTKPRKAPKKNEDEDKAFRAGISKKKVLKKSENESEASASETEKGKRKTRGKKLLYLIEDDLDSDESDGIKPGVKRPETPPEEREMFVKKQEEIKRMLAAKDTEAAKKLAAPTIDPIHFSLEKPKSPPPIPFSNEPASLSTIPKNVIESAKALDTDYNRIKPIAMGSHMRSNDGVLQSNDMNEEELARMMEEEDFAQHQLKLAGEAIARSKKLLELEAKEGEFAAYTKVNKEKEWIPPVESKKRSRKSKSSEKSNEEFPGFSKSHIAPQAPTNQTAPPMPPLVSSNVLQLPKSHQHQMPSQPSIIANLIQQQSSFPPSLTSMSNERPSVLSSFMSRPDIHPQLLKMHQSSEAFNQKIQHIPPEAYNLKNQPIPPEYVSKNQQLPPESYDPKHQQQLSQHQFEESEEKKKGRRKKFTPLRTDLVEGNLPKQAKLDQPSVIMATNPAANRNDDKNKAPRPDHPKLTVAAPPQIFNPATNPTPSVITRLLQPQQRTGPGPYPQGFNEAGQPIGNSGPRPYPEDMKNASPNKARTALQQPPMGGGLPQGSFGENPFVPRNIHPLYRAPPGYGVIPPHARLPPYPFHHLHPNLRPEYSAPYNIPPQFSYYAPPAHSRQPPQPSAIPLNHGASQLVAGSEDVANSIRNANNSEEPSETSEFGGLVSYFSSQQELD